jgi:hypothetical protein
MAREHLTYPEARSWAEKNIGKESKKSTPSRGRKTKSRWTPPRLRASL